MKVIQSTKQLSNDRFDHKLLRTETWVFQLLKWKSIFAIFHHDVTILFTFKVIEYFNYVIMIAFWENICLIRRYSKFFFLCHFYCPDLACYLILDFVNLAKAPFANFGDQTVVFLIQFFSLFLNWYLAELGTEGTPRFSCQEGIIISPQIILPLFSVKEGVGGQNRCLKEIRAQLFSLRVIILIF